MIENNLKALRRLRNALQEGMFRKRSVPKKLYTCFAQKGLYFFVHHTRHKALFRESIVNSEQAGLLTYNSFYRPSRHRQWTLF